MYLSIQLRGYNYYCDGFPFKKELVAAVTCLYFFKGSPTSTVVNFRAYVLRLSSLTPVMSSLLERKVL